MSSRPEADPSIQPPIYFAGGFGYDELRNRGVLDYLEDQGHSVAPALPNPEQIDPTFSITIGGVTCDISRKNAYRVSSRPEVELCVSNFQQARADALVDALAKERTPKVNAIFQSADALNGLLAAAQHPELFNNIVLAYPAGLTKYPNVFKSAPRVIRGVTANAREKSRSKSSTANFERTFPSRSTSQRKTSGGFSAASSVALSSQHRLLERLRNRDDAPGISLVLGLQDHMFPPERVIGSLEHPADVDFVLVLDTTHGINGNEEVMRQALGLFIKMEALRQERPAPPLIKRVILPNTIPKRRRDTLQKQILQIDGAA